ncbi:MAG: hypothetical protein HDKAJFGB_01241 [Anaerolineae bacterium]|nr:hypothetical protein [Anaerolineae bacterium]
MRIAENMRPQKFQMRAQLRFGVQTAARVIEIDMSARVEPRIFGGAQRVEFRGRAIFFRERGRQLSYFLAHTQINR